MSPEKKYVMEVEKGKEAADDGRSVGPVYRSIFGFSNTREGIDSCWDIFSTSVEKNPNKQMLGERETVNGKDGKYVWMTYKEVYDVVMKVGVSIRTCGVGQGSRCGIYSINCSKWIISMQACNAHGIYCVPLYDTLGAGAVKYIICHAEISIVFAEEKNILEVLKTCPNVSHCLKTLVSFGEVTAEQKLKAAEFGLSIHSWDDFLQLGKKKQFDLPVKKRTDVCTIMYTSGTTGDPKGVILTNGSVLSIISGVHHSLESMNQKVLEVDIFYSYLPLAHIFDRVMEEVFISIGAAIGFWRGDPKQLMEDIKELKPTVFCSVPRVLDKMYAGLIERTSSVSILRYAIFKLAYAYKLHYMKKGYKHVEAAPGFDKIVFSKIKDAFGGNIRLILSGGAPLATPVETFLRVVTGAHVLQGYGLTETCAGSFAGLPDDLSMIGTVGPPNPNIDARLESVPELGYDALSNPPRGEICMRGDALFSGYYKQEDLTKEVLIDGWFHTGDIGEWQPNGSMKIIDRKKNIFKLSQGEYVAVEKLENIFSRVTCIDAMWVYGNSFKSFLVAVVNPNKELLERWAEVNGVKGDFSSICEKPEARAYVLEELNKMAKENKVRCLY
ncbi:long chain acyl-CoA synthetase 4-like [Impatiens glandulifera]|uniref:long chain acyl-CoA synthetase 4-like n=1 Tax=Impatiens glandulifera TaxID=253017 RepID=UPI001FB183BC|nr:long chain acyl-CoA synthetase 4-like [Impatiens glandulifera]